MNSEILTKKELADTLKVSKRTVERALETLNGQDGIIYKSWEAFRVGKRWRFKVVKEILTTEAA